MEGFNVKAVYCPKIEDHPKGKKLLLLQNNSILVHCKDHGWVELEFSRAGEPINFDNVSVKATSTFKKIHFHVEPVPVLAIGDFERKKG